MNIKAFFVDALTSALELGIGTPDDVLRHVTPDVLAQNLPRPLWARLLTACLGAPKVDAQLVIETIGVPNLCEHIPSPIVWACVAEIGLRSLGKTPDVVARPVAVTSTPSGRTILAPPPEARPALESAEAATPVAIGPVIPAPAPTAAVDQPLADLITELEAGDDPPLNLRPRSPTGPRFRQSSTGIGGRGLGARRPQAAATPAAAAPPPPSRGSARRPATEVSEPEPETAVGNEQWSQREISVDDSQLVEWQASDGASSTTSAITGDDDFSDLGTRKR